MPQLHIPDDSDYQEVPEPDRRRNEPVNLNDDALIVRRLWITAYRSHVLATTGKASKYTPGPRWDIGIGKDKKPFWPKLANFIRSNNAIPELFIRAQFVRGCDPPYPNMAMNQSAVNRYKEYVRQSPRDCFLELKIQLNRLKHLYYRYSRPDKSEVDIMASILCDPSAELSPLFRYCQAMVLSGLEDVADLLRGPAAAQYSSDPFAYDEAWGTDLIPEDIRVTSFDIPVAGRVC